MRRNVKERRRQGDSLHGENKRGMNAAGTANGVVPIHVTDRIRRTDRRAHGACPHVSACTGAADRSARTPRADLACPTTVATHTDSRAQNSSMYSWVGDRVLARPVEPQETVVQAAEPLRGVFVHSPSMAPAVQVHAGHAYALHLQVCCSHVHSDGRTSPQPLEWPCACTRAHECEGLNADPWNHDSQSRANICAGSLDVLRLSRPVAS